MHFIEKSPSKSCLQLNMSKVLVAAYLPFYAHPPKQAVPPSNVVFDCQSHEPGCLFGIFIYFYSQKIFISKSPNSGISCFKNIYIYTCTKKYALSANCRLPPPPGRAPGGGVKALAVLFTCSQKCQYFWPATKKKEKIYVKIGYFVYDSGKKRFIG